MNPLLERPLEPTRGNSARNTILDLTEGGGRLLFPTKKENARKAAPFAQHFFSKNHCFVRKQILILDPIRHQVGHVIAHGMIRLGYFNVRAQHDEQSVGVNGIDQ